MSKQYTFEWDWKKRFQEWTWYAAGAAIFGPFILVAIIEPDWLGRLIGVTVVFTGLPAVLLWFALGPRKNLGSEGRTIWPEYITKHVGDKVYLGTRLLLIGLAGIFFYLVSFPLIKDLSVVVNNNGPLSETELVSLTRGNAITGLIIEHIKFEGKNEDRSALYFSPRHIMHGNTYEFLYLPNSGIILDAKPVSDPQ